MIKNILFCLLVIWSGLLNSSDLPVIEKSFKQLQNEALDLRNRAKNTIARSEMIEFRDKVKTFINLCRRSTNLASKEERLAFIGQARMMEEDILQYHNRMPLSLKSSFAVLQQRAEYLRYVQKKVAMSELLELANNVEEFKNEHFSTFYNLGWINIFNKLVDQLEDIRQYHKLSIPIENNILFKFQTLDDVLVPRRKNLSEQILKPFEPDPADPIVFQNMFDSMTKSN